MTKKERQHLAQHHAALSAEHSRAADLHTDLAVASESEKHAEAHKALAACHRAMSDSHASEGERHLAACKATADGDLEKATDSELVQELRGLVKALGGVVTPLPGGLSLIPRFGARDPKAEKDVVKAVDPTLRAVITDPSESQPTEIAFNAAQ